MKSIVRIKQRRIVYWGDKDIRWRYTNWHRPSLKLKFQDCLDEFRKSLGTFNAFFVALPFPKFKKSASLVSWIRRENLYNSYLHYPLGDKHLDKELDQFHPELLEGVSDLCQKFRKNNCVECSNGAQALCLLEPSEEYDPYSWLSSESFDGTCFGARATLCTRHFHEHLVIHLSQKRVNLAWLCGPDRGGFGLLHPWEG